MKITDKKEKGKKVKAYDVETGDVVLWGKIVLLAMESGSFVALETGTEVELSVNDLVFICEAELIYSIK